jgi:ribonucleoside-diphosphate reductase alpha chain
MTELNPNVVKLLKKRYLKTKEDGSQETPEEMFERVADHVGGAVSVGAWEAFKSVLCEWGSATNYFEEVMKSLHFMPCTPCLMNSGSPNGQLSACFVLPVKDTLLGPGSIMGTLQDMVAVHRSGGGTGFDFSKTRPKGSTVWSTGGKTDGPLSWISIYDEASEGVKQGGKRHGANMGILSINHPDILNFIKAKQDSGKYENFNFSVAVTDEFMEMLKETPDENWSAFFNNGDELIKEEFNVAELWNELCHASWESGEPGVFFVDVVNEFNPFEQKITSTNPCGEQPLLPYESCNLGHINLSKLYDPNDENFINRESFRKLCWLAVLFLDSCIDINCYPLEQIKDATFNTRKIGVGVLGFADLLLKAGIPYSSDRAVEIASSVAASLTGYTTEASIALGKALGNYPAGRKLELFPKRRNLTTTTIAPTGITSWICGASSAIEPVFAWEIDKYVLEQTMKEVHPIYAKWMAENELIDKPFETIKKLLPPWFEVAHDIPAEQHVKIQAAFQKHIHSGVSKTINLPESATPEDVSNIYKFAWELGCKGVTIYRDMSRDNQVLAKKGSRVKRIDIDRPDTIPGEIHKVQVDIGKEKLSNVYCTVGFKEPGVPFEVFIIAHPNKMRDVQFMETLTRCVSPCLRHQVPLPSLIKQLKKVEGTALGSLPLEVARVLELYTEDPTWVCQECNCRQPITGIARCRVCINCNHQECG